MDIPGSYEMAFWHTFAQDHEYAAQFLSTKCKDEVQALPGNSSAENWPLRQRQSAYASASILTTVAFVEATINEFFGAVIQGVPTVHPSIGPKKTEAIKNASRIAGSLGSLEKYDLALLVLGKQPFDPGSEPLQSVALLREIRNELVHNQPRWVPVGSSARESQINLERKFVVVDLVIRCRMTPLLCIPCGSFAQIAPRGHAKPPLPMWTSSIAGLDVNGDRFAG